MVAKISHGASLYGALAYNHEKVLKGSAEILSGHRMISDRPGLPSEDLRLVLLSFENHLIANRRTEKPVLHVSLSPAPEDRLDNARLMELAEKYMDKMGYGQQPFIVYRHDDTCNTHVHIVSVCIDDEGRKINDSYEHRRSMAACRELEQEFGNGETSEARTGNYSYSKEGKYQIRLTVDGQFEEKFLVNVRPKVDKDPYGELIKIDAPGFALQNEIISVRGLGNAKEWRWEFGETGMIDSREKNTLYSYSEAGTYEILLSTETTQYPVRHTIRIEPNFQRNDSADVQTLIGNDIRERLQAIVDGKPFNQNYNYILSSYLCNNPDVVVTVNGEKHNDFYSYCQGLKIIGRKRLVIENVVVDIKDDESDECVKQLLVTQYDKPLTK